MKATIKMFWVIVECPHCHHPQVVNKYADLEGRIWNLDVHIVKKCKDCDEYYDVVVETGGTNPQENDVVKGAIND